MWALDYRPKTFDKVIEQTSAIQALTGAEKSYSTIILHGESGTGKTTLARIFADSINGEALEINGADNNGVDNVRALLASAVYSPIMNDYRVFIIDECFHANTRVSMTNGDTKMISTIKVGDSVRNLTGDGVVTNVFKNKVTLDRLVLVKLSNGEELLTTKNHLFFTEDGWVEAQHLKKGEKLYDNRKNEDMCDLWGGIQDKVGFQKLLKGMQARLTSKVWAGVSKISGWITDTKRGINKNVTIESNVEQSDYSKDDGNQEEKWNIKQANKKSWWKWENNNSSTNAERCAWGSLCVGAGYKNTQNESRWLPTLIQSRPSISKESVGDRGGWESPSLEKEYSQRLKEDTTVGGVRVESVEIYESTSRRESFRDYIDYIDTSLGYIELFDLEVSNHPSYYAENALVHNCHMLTNAAWNALLKILEESPKTTKWVLCTTEFSKIPATIKSRSLIVKVDKISKAGIRKQLTEIIATEEHEVQEDILAEIVNRSEGRMREAITALEAYVTSGNLPYSFTTLDAIKLLTLTMNGKAKLAIPIIDRLTNEDVYVIIKMLNDYMKLLILRQELPQSIKAETILEDYTSISPRYLPELRELQDALWVSSTERGEQWAVTLKIVYGIYDKMMTHYNDFRDGRLAVSFALLDTMGGIKSSV